MCYRVSVLRWSITAKVDVYENEGVWVSRIRGWEGEKFHICQGTRSLNGAFVGGKKAKCRRELRLLGGGRERGSIT